MPIALSAVAEKGKRRRRPLPIALLAVALDHRRNGDRQWPLYKVANGPPPIALSAVAFETVFCFFAYLFTLFTCLHCLDSCLIPFDLLLNYKITKYLLVRWFE